MVALIIVACAAYRTDTRLDSFELDNHKAALTCHAGGASLYFRAPAELERSFVTAMANAVGMNFAAMYPNGSYS
jgi:hypothetical protein